MFENVGKELLKWWRRWGSSGWGGRRRRIERKICDHRWRTPSWRRWGRRWETKQGRTHNLHPPMIAIKEREGERGGKGSMMILEVLYVGWLLDLLLVPLYLLHQPTRSDELIKESKKELSKKERYHLMLCLILLTRIKILATRKLSTPKYMLLHLFSPNITRSEPWSQMLIAITDPSLFKPSEEEGWRISFLLVFCFKVPSNDGVSVNLLPAFIRMILFCNYLSLLFFSLTEPASMWHSTYKNHMKDQIKVLTDGLTNVSAFRLFPPLSYCVHLWPLLIEYPGLHILCNLP